ncbi:MAG: glycerate kinase [Clostridium sp.]|nr:glycerate kinase [Clostridium sp.]
MQKFIILPDSFKGTISSIGVANVMKSSIKSHFPEAEIISIPVADGGEGSVDAFLSALDGDRIDMVCSGPYFEKINTYYGLIDNGNTAVIEMASAAGLPLVGDRKDPSKTTTYGTGEMIRDALGRGVKKIIIGLGGSSTNDAAAGCLSALGVKFLNKDNKVFIPTGENLNLIEGIDLSGLDKRIEKTDIEVMCDIDNPLYGENGAAYIFGPQKGADVAMVKFLDSNLKYFSKITEEYLHLDLKDLPGAGAAGGMGYGIASYLGGNLKMGIDIVLDTVDFDQNLKDTDMVFTGEGNLDSQSLSGKVVIGISRRCKKANVPVIAVVGGVSDDIESVYEEGVTSVFSINRRPESLDISKHNTKENLAFTMDNIIRILKLNL